MARRDIEAKFIEWNFAGRGSDRGIEGHYRFRKHVMLYYHYASRRVVKDGKGQPIMLRQDYGGEDVQTQPNNGTNHDIAYRYWEVPALGVMSRFEGDELSEKDLHERQHYLMIAEVAALMEERVALMSGKELDAGGASKILKLADRMAARYFNYGLIFGLKWGEMPRLYKEELGDEMKRRIAAYNTPKQQEARHRAHARNVAKKAFGLK